jgi:hypothetical protein
MDRSKTALERAFELARSGTYLAVADIKTAIGREGYAKSQLDGPSLRRQLNELIRKSIPQSLPSSDNDNDS